jgi:hypothetical protein
VFCKKGDLSFSSSFFPVFLSDCDESDVNLGIDIAMSYASEDPKSPLSNDHTPLCGMFFSHLFFFRSPYPFCALYVDI